MVKLILGEAGSGKTKDLITAINTSVEQETGSVVCIERGETLRFDISHRVRLIDIKDYSNSGLEFMKGFISGLHAGNFDISCIYIDSLAKMVGADNAEAFCNWCSIFSEVNMVNFVITLSIAPDQVSEGLKQYL